MTEGQGMWHQVKGALGGLFGSSGLTEDKKMEVEVTFGLIGFLAKADGIITSFEADFAARLQDELNLNSAGRDIAYASFDAGRHKDYDVEQAVHRFLGTHRPGSEPMEHLFNTLLRLSLSDDRVYPREREALERLASAFGITEKSLEQRMQSLRG